MSKAAKFEVLKRIAFGSVSSSYASIGAVTSNPWRKFTITNNTDVPVIVTTDSGESAGKWFLPKTSYITEDVSTNENGDYIELPAKTQFSVKDDGSAATSGDVVIQGGLYI